MEQANGTQVMRDKIRDWSITYMCIIVCRELATLDDDDDDVRLDDWCGTGVGDVVME
jgi:hypothetical protein